MRKTDGLGGANWPCFYNSPRIKNIAANLADRYQERSIN